MREDLLANLSDSVRPAVATSDDKAPWTGLVKHFLQTCGPPDVKAGVCAMLEEAVAEEPPRIFQQRVQALVFSWHLAQTTFYGVSPEAGRRGQPAPPHYCSPFVPAHEQ